MTGQGTNPDTPASDYPLSAIRYPLVYPCFLWNSAMYPISASTPAIGMAL